MFAEEQETKSTHGIKKKDDWNIKDKKNAFLNQVKLLDFLMNHLSIVIAPIQ
jgi:hypothetical protein